MNKKTVIHSLSGYSEGRTDKAYLSNGKLNANVEGVNTFTPLRKNHVKFHGLNC